MTGNDIGGERDWVDELLDGLSRQVGTMERERMVSVVQAAQEAAIEGEKARAASVARNMDAVIMSGLLEVFEDGRPRTEAEAVAEIHEKMAAHPPTIFEWVARAIERGEETSVLEE